MKRRKFLLSIATGVPAVAASPFHLKAAAPGKGFKVAAGEGRIHGHIRLKGVNANILDLKISGKDTAGGLAIFEQISQSPNRGTPLHIHSTQDEVFYVLEGEYYFQVGEEKYKLRTGDSIFLPRNIPHAWTQVSQKGKMTVTVQPAGKLEEFFVALASLTKELTPTEMTQIFAAHDMRIVGPPLAVD
ncbi:cupin domain-containing protein [Hymenobacter arizonensis]|uniref:Cupin domain-containing protein n=1 Tax=Hymenobacter arizonensis TaxID=1227077 RepID=A0A1I5UEV6_HYMAR|nr:cupin domain-containing protein [Hymenobacter arizonensis]SFP93804.1 Cupin domain-containing protein [Hymenobacter arizonensis]